MKCRFRWLIAGLWLIIVSLSPQVIARAKLEFVNVEQRVSGVHCKRQRMLQVEAIGRVNGKSVEATNAIQKISKVKAMEKLKPSSLRRRCSERSAKRLMA